MSTANLLFLRWCRGQGVGIVVDAFVHPYLWRDTLRIKEQAGVPLNARDFLWPLFLERYREVFSLATLVLCPSHWVAEGVAQLDSSFAHKTRLCHYGTSVTFPENHNVPKRGRFFWAGRGWLGKGLLDLAAAANALQPANRHMEFRVAGVTEPTVVNDPRFHQLTFLGHLDRKRLADEFRDADAFVLPTHSEGSAAVVLEALQAGCPVITTRQAGVDLLADGVNSLIVAPGDAIGLANALSRILHDRQLRKQIVYGAKQLLPYYSLDGYRRRLIASVSLATHPHGQQSQHECREHRHCPL